MNEMVMERELIALPIKNALDVFTEDDHAAINAIMASVREAVDAFKAEEHDITTAKGREAIKSFAFNATKSNTALAVVCQNRAY